MNEYKKLVAPLIVVVFLVILFLGAYILREKNNQQKPITPRPISETEDVNNQKSSNDKYTFQEYFNGKDYPNNYSYSYPQNIFKQYTTAIYLPYNQKKLKVTDAFKHEIPIEYCGPSGECSPTTIDMSFGSIFIPDSLSTIKNSEIGSELQIKQILDITVYELKMGVEGEGMNYTFLEWNDRTLMFFHKYIDETVLVSYQKNTDFIPYKEQVEIMNKIIGSID